MGTGAWTGWSALNNATDGGAGTVAKGAFNLAKGAAEKALNGKPGDDTDNNPGIDLDNADSWMNLAKKMGTDFGPSTVALALTYFFGPGENTYIRLAMGVAAACAVYYVQHSLLKASYNGAAVNPEPAAPAAKTNIFAEPALEKN
ncbi:MAG: hypothetical protein DYH13_06725 [Alphaproteobacteria bacterium PRO2]|nr:hypothetical protein [Alphaproteobacteria bacterium PRO2]